MEIDYLRMDRLREYYKDDFWQWTEEPISLEDITEAIENNHPEEDEPYGDGVKYLPDYSKTNDYHIGRVIYYINHPEEIKEIMVDNLCVNGTIVPEPLIYDGNHRFMAACWLHKNRNFEKIACVYGGLVDLLDYLTGESDKKPQELY